MQERIIKKTFQSNRSYDQNQQHKTRMDLTKGQAVTSLFFVCASKTTRPTLREEPNQINVTLQQKLLAANLSSVCTVYKQ